MLVGVMQGQADLAHQGEGVRQFDPPFLQAQLPEHVEQMITAQQFHGQVK